MSADLPETDGVPTAEIRLLVNRLQCFDTLSKEEICVLNSAITGTATFQSDADLVVRGDSPKFSTLLISGWAARYKILENGGRQITAIHVPGDFVDLHGFLLRPMDHAVLALSTCRVALAAHDRLRAITEGYPHLTRLLWLITLVDAAMHREWLVAMGRLRTFSQLAHLICELVVRLNAIGLMHDNAFEFPVSQSSIADMLGVSQVHVNRAVQDLRARDLLTWQNRTITVLNWNALKGFAQFDPTYLFQKCEPR